MADKFLSVKEAKEDLVQHFLVTNTFDTDKMDALISAVRREQDLIATKRERERAVKILCDSLDMHDCTKLVKGQSYATIKKKILEEK